MATENVPESWDSTCCKMERCFSIQRMTLSGSCSQMNGLLSQVLDLSNNEHVFLSTGDIHYPVTINLSLYKLVLSPLHGRNVMYGISNSQGWCRPLFQVVIDRGSNGPAVRVWYFNPVPSNINTHKIKSMQHTSRYLWTQVVCFCSVRENGILGALKYELLYGATSLTATNSVSGGLFFQMGSLTIKLSSKLGFTLQKIFSNSSLH